MPNAGYLYEDCCARSKYEVNDSPRVTSFFYAESFLHFLAFFFLSLRQFGISNENSDPRFVIRVEGMKGFKLGFVAIQSDFLHVVFLSFIRINVYIKGEGMIVRGCYNCFSLVYRFLNKYKYSLYYFFSGLLLFVLTTILVIRDPFSFYSLRCASRKSHYYGDFIFEIGENNNLLTIKK